MAYDNLKLRKKFYTFSAGYATQDEPERITDDQSPDMLNVRPLGYGAYTVRNGVTRVGNDQGVGSRTSIWNFARLGLETLVSSRATTLEYLDEADQTWKAVPGIPTYTADKRFGFANDETYMYGCNGVEQFFRWDGTNNITQYASAPKGNIMEFFLRRLYVAGITAEPAKVYYSVILSPHDFTGTGSGSFVVGEGGDAITSMRVFTSPSSGDKVLFVFKKSSRVYMVFFDDSGLLNIQEVKRDTGAVNQQSTLVVENDIMYIDTGNNIANMGYRENITADLRTESTTSVIDRTTTSIDFSSACGVYWKKRRMVFMNGKSFGSNFNDTTLVYFYDFKSWWRWGGIFANEFAIYQDEVVWASSVDSNVYKYDETTFSDQEGPIRSYRSTKDMEFENRDNVAYMDMYKQARFVIVRGYISPGASMSIKIAYDGKYTQPIERTFNGTDEGIVAQGVSISFGNNIFGHQVFGGYPLSPTAFPMREFLCVISLDMYSFLRMRITPEVQGAGYPYIIKGIAVWAELQEDEKFPAGIKI